MDTGTWGMLLRKILTTFVATLFFSILMVFIMFQSGFESEYNRGNNFLGWVYVYFLYSGAIIALYGNLVSVATEYAQRKWFNQHDWLYIVILGCFGLAPGVISQSTNLFLLGTTASLLYAIFDKWIYHRSKQGKGIKMFFILPIATLVVCWGYLQLISPPLPPFTAEDAVVHATSGEGSITDDFPNRTGEWEGIIEGYEVHRETSAEEIGKDLYLVTFREYWSSGDDRGNWSISYKVDRQSMTLYEVEGDEAPYNLWP